MQLTEENKRHIDSLDVYQLLYKNRFAPIGDPWFQGETGEYWIKRLAQKRDEDHGAFVAASKDMGWERR
jgi:hypothetical protein